MRDHHATNLSYGAAMTAPPEVVKALGPARPAVPELPLVPADPAELPVPSRALPAHPGEPDTTPAPGRLF